MAIISISGKPRNESSRFLPRFLPERGTPQRLIILVALAVVLLVVLPYFFWFFTWYGWSLDTAQVDAAFADPVRPAKAEQLVMQMTEKLARGDGSIRRWYPRLVELSRNPDDDLRGSIARMMGKDPLAPEFREALRRLVQDPVPMVRRDAAISLAVFRDESARDELNKMLEVFRVTTPIPGRLQLRIDPGDLTKPYTVIARVNDVNVVAWVPGKVAQVLAKDGADVVKGQELIVIEPSPDQVDQARRALHQLKQ